MTVGELESRMSARELNEWMAEDRLQHQEHELAEAARRAQKG